MLSLDEMLFYVILFEVNVLLVINVVMGEIIQLIIIGVYFDSFIFLCDGIKVWVMNCISNSVLVIDLVVYQYVVDILLEKYDGMGMSNKFGVWVMVFFSDEKILLIFGMVRGDIVCINIIMYQKEDFFVGDVCGMILVMCF